MEFFKELEERDLIGISEQHDQHEQYNPDIDNNEDNTVQKKKNTKTQLVNYTPKHNRNKVIKITKSGAFIKFDDIKADDQMSMLKKVRKIENYFTLKTMQIIGTFKQNKRCKVDKKKKRIIVPRFGVFEVLSSKYGLKNYCTVNKIKKGEDPKVGYDWKASLYPNQKIIIDHINKNNYKQARVKAGSAGVILNLEAGQGKTYVAAYFIGQIKKKTAIILHSTSMLEDWEKALRVCYGDELKIGYYHGKKKKDGDVVIHIINSAVSNEFKLPNEKYVKKSKTKKELKKTTDDKKNNEAEEEKYITYNPIEYFDRFGFIIFDECHLYANKFAGRVFKRAQAPYMLGLSATPDENSNKFDRLVWWGIGDVLDAKKIPGYVSTDKSFTGKIHRIMYYGEPKYTRLIKNKITDMVSVAETIGMICADPYRTAVILMCIKKCLSDGLFTFVFADRRDYLEVLRNRLIEEKSMSDRAEIMVNDNDYMRIVGGDKNATLALAAQKSKVIFTTYQYMGTGKSIIKMNALVMVTPRKSKMKQYVKRIFRLGSDMSIERQVYDIVDMKTVLKNQWYSRNKYYKEKKFTVIEEKHYSPNSQEGIDEAKTGGTNKSKKLTKKSTTNTKLKKSSNNKKNNDIINKIMKKLL